MFLNIFLFTLNDHSVNHNVLSYDDVWGEKGHQHKLFSWRLLLNNNYLSIIVTVALFDMYNHQICYLHTITLTHLLLYCYTFHLWCQCPSGHLFATPRQIIKQPRLKQFEATIERQVALIISSCNPLRCWSVVIYCVI